MPKAIGSNNQFCHFLLHPLKDLSRLIHDKFLWSILNSRKSILIKLLCVCVCVILSMQFNQFESSDVLSVSNTYTNSVTKCILSVSNAYTNGATLSISKLEQGGALAPLEF